MRIAIGGIHVESCTFSPLLSKRGDFTVKRGEQIVADYPFLQKFDGVSFEAVVIARAIPGGSVQRSFYEDIKTELVEYLKENGPWDGIFLPMHGAVHVDGMDDAEGDWVAAIRDAVGGDCLISASYDLHGNVTPRIVDNLDILSAYRHAPHIDWYETVERACTLLIDCLKNNVRPHKAFIRIPVVLPGERTSTEWEPGKSLYEKIPDLLSKSDGVMDASILVGYVWADEPRSTASVFAIGTDKSATDLVATQLAQAYWDVREEFQFGVPTGSVDETIHMAMDAPESPIFISDSGDNPTAGGAGDIPYFLERLVALNVPDAVYASIPDAEAVNICHSAGIGAEVDLVLGGKLDPINGSPLAVHGKVVALASPEWTGVGGGTNKQAVVQIGGVHAIITERRTPFHYESDFQRLNIEPTQHKIVAVKVGYLVPDLKRMASKAFLALSPGAVNQDIVALPYKRIGRPIYPLDPELEWSPQL